MNVNKLIEIIDPQAGEIRETVFLPQEIPDNDPLMEVARNKIQLLELATTSQFPQLMKDGLKAILFSSYNGVPNTHELWTMTERSNKPDETWLEGSTLGLLPVVGEGKPYPTLELALDRVVNVINQKRGGIIEVTREMTLFDQLGMIRQQTADLGQAMAMTEENDAYTILNTTGNYNRTIADNDIGNNTNTTTFSPAGLELAFSTLRTMKDRKSGRYLGVRPDTLCCGPRLEFFAKQFLLSPEMGGMGDSNAAISYGGGTGNPFRGAISNIIVSPWFGTSFQWCLMQRGKAVVKQVVWDLELTQQIQQNSDAFFERGVLRYKASKMYGVGMLNDRFAYLSDSTTAPAVD